MKEGAQSVSDPFDIFEVEPMGEPAPAYELVIASIKGGPKGDMDREDV
jgi:hypothetical protein